MTGPTTIFADPGTDEPIIHASGPAAQIIIQITNPTGLQQIHIGGLSLLGGASLEIESEGIVRSEVQHQVLVVGNNTSSAPPLFTVDSTSTLDITDNDVIVLLGNANAQQSAAAYASIYNQVSQASDNGNWDLPGITSSVAKSSNTTDGVACAQASELAQTDTKAGTFDGVPLSAAQSAGGSAILIKYTLLGDTQLRGTVDGTDYSTVLAGYDTPGGDWPVGDFFYAGTIDASDYSAVLANYDIALTATAQLPRALLVSTDPTDPQHTLDLSWQAPTEADETGFQITEISQDGGQTATRIVEPGSNPAGLQTCTWSGLSPGVHYDFYVQTLYLGSALNPLLGPVSGTKGMFTASSTFSLVTPATATVSATGTGIELSVLGDDPLGGSDITYAWSEATPTDNPTPVFSEINGNGASTIFVPVNTSGTYEFQLTLTDGSGDSLTPYLASSPLTVTVATIPQITITPASTTVALGASTVFSATVADQFGNPLALSGIHWSASKGTGVSDGDGNYTYTAPTSSPGTATITATDGSSQSTASAFIPDTNPTITRQAAGSPSTDGTTVNLSVRASDLMGPGGLIYNWTALTIPTGAGDPIFSDNDDNSSKNDSATLDATGTYVFAVTVTNTQGLSTTSEVTVNVGQVPTLTVFPTTATIPAGETQRFTAVYDDQFGNYIGEANNVTWHTATGDDGSVDSQGNYTASSDTAGTQSLYATDGLTTASASVTIPPSTPTLSATETSTGSGINLSWAFDTTGTNGGGSNDDTGFDILRAINGSTTFNEIAAGLSAGTASYTDTNVTLGDTYTYAIRPYVEQPWGKVYGTNGTAASVLFAGIITATPPTQTALVNSGNPVLIELPFTDTNTSGTDSATIDWGDGNTATGTIVPASGSNPAYVTGSYTYAADGSYSVTVTITDGSQAPSVSTIPITIGTTPDAPTIGTASPSNNGATVSWSAPSSGSAPTGYNIYGSADSGSTWVQLASVDATQINDTLTGLALGTSYEFYVTATNAFGESVPSATASTTTGSGAPDAPTDITVSADSGQVEVDWTPADDLATGFTVWGSANGGTYTQLAQADASTSYADLTGLIGGDAYTFYVTAANSHGTSPASTNVPATAPTTPTTPPGLTAMLVGGNIELDWTDSDSSIAQYNIYESTDGGSTFAYVDDTGDNTYTIASPAAGTTPQFYVVAQNARGTAQSNTAPCSVPAGGISNLTATVIANPTTNDVDGSTVQLTWTADNSASGYVIGRLADGDITDAPTPVKILSGGSTNSFVDNASDLAGSIDHTQAYTYTVEPYYLPSGVTTAPTALDTAHTGAPASADDYTDAISNFHVSINQDNSVELTWSYQGQGTPGFEVEYQDQSVPGNNYTKAPYFDTNISSTASGGYTASLLGNFFTAGENYGFRIRADNGDGTVSPYAQTTFNPPSPASTSVDPNIPGPSVTSVQTESGGALVTLSANPDYTQYSLGLKTVSSSIDPLGDLPGCGYGGGAFDDTLSNYWSSAPQTRWFNANGTSGATYTFGFYGTDNNGQSPVTSTFSITFPGKLPPALSLQDQSQGTTITWAAPGGYDSGTVNFYRLSGSGANQRAILLASDVDLNAGSVGLSGLPQGTSTVFAIFDGESTDGQSVGWSPYSNMLQVTSTPVPNQPTGFSAAVDPNDDTQVDIHWNNNAGSQSEYILQRTLKSGIFRTIATLPADVTEYTDVIHGTAEQSVSAKYSVVAANGTGSASPVSSATVNNVAILPSLPYIPPDLAAFEFGNGPTKNTSSFAFDMYPGAAGNGWAGPWAWKASGSAKDSATVSLSNPLSTNFGRYLSASVTASKTAGAASVSRDYAGTGGITGTTPFELSFVYRYDGISSGSATSTDRVMLFGNNQPEKTETASDTWEAYANPTGPNTHWFFNGVESAMTLVRGDVYVFNLDMMPNLEDHLTNAVGYYEARITDEHTNVTASVPIVDFRSAPNQSTYFEAGLSLGAGQRGNFSLDEVEAFNASAPIAPVILGGTEPTGGQPASVTATVGQNVSFTAAAKSDLQPLQVQWEVSTDGGNTYSPITGNQSATTPTLTLSSVQLAQNGHPAMYEAVFKNAAGSTTSNPATLTVEQPTTPGSVVYAPTNSNDPNFMSELDADIAKAQGATLQFPNVPAGSTYTIPASSIPLEFLPNTTVDFGSGTYELNDSITVDANCVVSFGVGTYNANSPIALGSGDTITGAAKEGPTIAEGSGATAVNVPFSGSSIQFNLTLDSSYGADGTDYTHAPYGFYIAGNSTNVTIQGLNISSNLGLVDMVAGSGYAKISILDDELEYGGGYDNGTTSEVLGINDTRPTDTFDVEYNDFHNSQFDPTATNGPDRCLYTNGPSNSNFDHNLLYDVSNGFQFNGSTEGNGDLNNSGSFNYAMGLHGKLFETTTGTPDANLVSQFPQRYDQIFDYNITSGYYLPDDQSEGVSIITDVAYIAVSTAYAMTHDGAPLPQGYDYPAYYNGPYQSVQIDSNYFRLEPTTDGSGQYLWATPTTAPNDLTNIYSPLLTGYGVEVGGVGDYGDVLKVDNNQIGGPSFTNAIASNATASGSGNEVWNQAVLGGGVATGENGGSWSGTVADDPTFPDTGTDKMPDTPQDGGFATPAAEIAHEPTDAGPQYFPNG